MCHRTLRTGYRQYGSKVLYFGWVDRRLSECPTTARPSWRRQRSRKANQEDDKIAHISIYHYERPSSFQIPRLVLSIREKRLRPHRPKARTKQLLAKNAALCRIGRRDRPNCGGSLEAPMITAPPMAGQYVYHNFRALHT